MVTASILAAAVLASAAGAQGVTVVLHNTPDPPRVGRNQFEIVVSDSGGARVKDVSVQLQLSRRISPYMRRTIGLKLESDGSYRGFGEMTRAGDWTVVAVVRRDAALLTTRAFSVTVK